MGPKGVNLFFLLSGIVFVSAQRTDEKPTCEADDVRKYALEKIEEIKHNINQNDWQYMAKKKHGTDGQLLLEFKEITDLMGKTFQPRIPDNVLGSVSFALAEKQSIEDSFVVFKRFQHKPDSELFKRSWNDFSLSCLNDSPNKKSVLKSLEIIQDTIVNDIGNKNIFNLASEDYKNLKCDREQSVQQFLFNMYTVLQMTQLKAYTMVQFSWMLLKLYDKGNFTLESELMRQRYLERISQQANIITDELKGAPNDIFKCDPHIHVKNETYTDITKFLQGLIINEVDLNMDKTCKEDCRFYQYTRQYGCFKDKFCSKQPVCNGNIVGCNFVDSDMWICQAPKQSNRRYNWIEYENGRTLGPKGSCSNPVSKVDSWWRWVFWHCSYCICLCDDPNDIKTDRYFNMRSVVSDIANNKVVTGLRFIKSNRIIHLQIQEGELIKNGQINTSTITWHPIDDYNIHDPSVVVGTDYHMLTWEHRAIDLDDLIAPDGYVLTGVRFRRVGGHLNFEIQCSEIDFNNGTLIAGGEKSLWISNDNTDGSFYKPRTKVILRNPDIPTRSHGQSKPDSKSDQFIEFTNSDLDLDAGQTTVPYIDTQLVAPHPPVPLKGAGIYHKGKRYSGGFIAPKVFTFNYGPYITDFFPEINEAQF